MRAGQHPMARSIAILSAASLAWNPRVLKEAQALARAGFRVTVLGASEGAAGLARDERLAAAHGFTFKSVAPAPTGTCIARLWRQWCRLRYRLGRELNHRVGYTGPGCAGLYAPELERQALLEAADYMILHLETAVLIGERLLARGCRLGLDMEDWYSQDLLPEVQRNRPVGMLQAAERKLMDVAAHVTCPSQVMSRELAQHYGCRRTPAVIHNSFPWGDRTGIDGRRLDRGTSERPSIFWFSQTIGPGRGLEDLLAALPRIEARVEVHLRGECAPGFAAWLARSIPDTHRDCVAVHPLVPLQELPSRIAEHDIGFAGEMLYCRSRDLTITNKILQYLLAGLAVVASDTAGQREVAALAAGAVFLYPSGKPTALADHINWLLSDEDRLKTARWAAVRAAASNYCWERDEKRLVELVRFAIIKEPMNNKGRS